MIQDTFIWLRNCILSCNHKVQLECCTTLIERFTYIFHGDKECKLMVDDLLTELSNKETSISI